MVLTTKLVMVALGGCSLSLWVAICGRSGWLFTVALGGFSWSPWVAFRGRSWWQFLVDLGGYLWSLGGAVGY